MISKETTVKMWLNNIICTQKYLKLKIERFHIFKKYLYGYKVVWNKKNINQLYSSLIYKIIYTFLIWTFASLFRCEKNSGGLLQLLCKSTVITFPSQGHRFIHLDSLAKLGKLVHVHFKILTKIRSRFWNTRWNTVYKHWNAIYNIIKRSSCVSLENCVSLVTNSISIFTNNNPLCLQIWSLTFRKKIIFTISWSYWLWLTNTMG